MEQTAKQRIMRTAFDLFMQQGYQDTTLREIAQKCGFSHVNVLKHYSSKGMLAISIIRSYIMQLLQDTKRRAASAGVTPSAQLSGMYWLIHYTFMSRNACFARLYLDTYNAARNEFYDLMTELSSRGKVITVDLMNSTSLVDGAEAELYSKLLVDSDLHSVEILMSGSIEPLWAAQSMEKLVQLLLLRASEDQVVHSTSDTLKEFREVIDSSVQYIEACLFS